MGLCKSIKENTNFDLYGDDAYLIISSSTFLPPSMTNVTAHMIAFSCASHAFACTASIDTIAKAASVSEATVKRTVRYLREHGVLITQKVDDFNYARIFNPRFIQIIAAAVKESKGRSKISKETREFAHKLLTEFVETVVDNKPDQGSKCTPGEGQNDFPGAAQNEHQNSVTDHHIQNTEIKNAGVLKKFSKDFWEAIRDVRAYLNAGKESFQQRQEERRMAKAKPAYARKQRDVNHVSAPQTEIPEGFKGSAAPVVIQQPLKKTLSMADRMMLVANNYCAALLPSDLISRCAAVGVQLK